MSTVGCPPGTIKVYDSLLTTSLKRLVADLMLHGGKKITIQHIHVQFQTGTSDVDYLQLPQPQPSPMALTLISCNSIRNLYEKPFKRVISKANPQYISLKTNCSKKSNCNPYRMYSAVLCMPQSNNGHKMIRCTNCAEWFHMDCVNALAAVIENIDLPWNCPACC